jgi:hypothetical protein
MNNLLMYEMEKVSRQTYIGISVYTVRGINIISSQGLRNNLVLKDIAELREFNIDGIIPQSKDMKNCAMTPK